MTKSQTKQHADMITLGIDMASDPAGKGTSLCWIEWKDGQPKIIIHPDCNDDKLNRLISDAKTKEEKIGVEVCVGIDAPFGWPMEFKQAVQCWTSSKNWDEEFRDRLRFRKTDFMVRDRQAKLKGNIKDELRGKPKAEQKKWKISDPLSVSSDKIALPAMRTMALLLRHKVTDRSGGHRGFYEVYPAGSLQCWGLPSQCYKTRLKSGAKASEAQEARAYIIDKLTLKGFKASVPDECKNSDHALDALIASLTARLAALGQTVGPFTTEEVTAAKIEGWIHLPIGDNFPVS